MTKTDFLISPICQMKRKNKSSLFKISFTNNQLYMAHRIYNYSAFYVAEPFNPCNLGANATPDFCYYNMLRAWKGADNTFPFLDAHETTYNVRDNSSWDTLRKRLHDRLDNSKNIILFLTILR